MQTVLFRQPRGPSPGFPHPGTLTVNTTTRGYFLSMGQRPRSHLALGGGGVWLLMTCVFISSSIFFCASRRLKACKHLTTYSKPHPALPPIHVKPHVGLSSHLYKCRRPSSLGACSYLLGLVCMYHMTFASLSDVT